MKVSIGMNLQPGAWGGGNQFGKALCSYLQARDVQVCFDLNDSELDIILLAEPNSRLKISAYGHKDILRYLAMKNRRALVVHRINNTSEARDDEKKEFNKFRIDANKVADHTVFVSNWVRDRYLESGFDVSRPASTILNGSDKKLWQSGAKKGSKKGKNSKKLKLVTHHWSNHWNKGFAVYQQLDNLLADPKWSDRIEFTYIGRLPDGFEFKNSKYLEPLSGKPLAKALSENNAYVTGAMHESGGHHNLEAGFCGLPILYLKSGSMPEYCQGFGLEFTMDTFEAKLEEMVVDWQKWQKKMPAFPHTADNMCAQYFSLFQELLLKQQEVRAKRNWLGNLPWVWRTLFRKN
ncbi:MAG: glycosyltransferase, partial [Magnetococcales bacterium]|nr:glycosyltransferase [Magnetococcales bacterium]